MMIKLSIGFINTDHIMRFYLGTDGTYSILTCDGDGLHVTDPDDIKKIRSILNHRVYCDLSRLSNEAKAWRKINNKEHDESTK